MLVVITPPKASRYEAKIANQLFEEGLHTLYLRLPNAEVDRYVVFLEEISPRHHHKIVLCDHYELLEQFNLGGIYVSSPRREYPLPPLAPHQIVSTGIHSLNELSGLSFTPDIVLLSPVFDSISKVGYCADPQLSQLKEQLSLLPIPVLAMGGVTSDNVDRCYELGFDGVAVLGDIWGEKGREVARFRAYSDPAMLSLAGHDPSGGAGIIADARVAESLGVRCVTIPATLTVQKKDAFQSSMAVDDGVIKDNLTLNIKDCNIRVAKVGMVSSPDALSRMVQEMKSQGIMRIIWDPIISATSGKQQILQPHACPDIKELMRSIFLVTPNLPECKIWFGSDKEEVLQGIVDDTGCSILLKGGHREPSSEKAIDILYRPHQEPISFTVPRYGSPKHGTGCALSSAIASFLALGRNLPNACREAQRLVSGMMTSHRGLLPAVRCFTGKRWDKKNLLRHHKLQYITNTDDADLLMKRCRAVLEGGGRWIQLRLKDATTEERTLLGHRLRSLCDLYDAVLIIDDDVEAVLRTGADGVHLGREDMSPLMARQILGDGKIIGSTCNTVDDVLRAYHCGSDYIGAGPFRTTVTKKKLAPILGGEGLRDLVMFNRSLRYPMPMVAIGGITLSDTEAVMATGVSGIAVSGVLDTSNDMRDVCRRFISQIGESP